IERIADLRSVLNRPIERQRSFERRAFYVVHHKIVRPNVMQRANVWMIQRGDGTGLAFEALGEFLVRNFDRNKTIQPRVAAFVHFPHATGADARKDLVRAESRWMET